MSLTLERTTTAFRGTFHSGVIVLQDAVTFPEGTAVEVTLPEEEPHVFARKEFVAWDEAAGDAWSHIAQWEAEEESDPETLA